MAIEYDFDALRRENNEDYIFQLVSGRPLTSIYHSHDFFEFVCVLRGDITQTLNGENVICKEKSVTLLTPIDMHNFTGQSENAEIISLSIRKREFEAFLKIYGIAEFRKSARFDFPKISKLYGICQETNFVSDNDCKLMLSMLLHAYLSQNEFLTSGDGADSFNISVKEMQKAENLRDGIDAFVRLSNYSRSHLARLVKKRFGTGLKAYINELRLKQAYNDLVWTNESAETISEKLGFLSYSHFSRIFKERFSVSPSELRKGHFRESAD